jgi:hypothetical protein
VLQEEHRAVADAGQLRAEATVEALLVVLLHDGILVLGPGLAEGRVRDAVVEALSRMLIAREGAAELDVLREIAPRIGLQRTQQHAGQCHRVGLGLEFLAVRHERRCDPEPVAQGVDVIHAVGQEATCTAGGVVHRPDEPGVLLEEVVVGSSRISIARCTTSRGVMKSSAASFTSAPKRRIRCS